MPIDLEDFFNNNFGGKNNPTFNENKIVLFLENSDSAWKAREIAKEANINESSIGVYLKRLVNKGLISYKKPYYAKKKMIKELNKK